MFINEINNSFPRYIYIVLYSNTDHLSQQYNRAREIEKEGETPTNVIRGCNTTCPAHGMVGSNRVKEDNKNKNKNIYLSDCQLF